MANKIPSSLKWLIDKRARLDGEIQKTRQAAARARELIQELRAVEKDLAAIDRALKLHDLEVDVQFVRPVRSHYNRIKAPHGLLTRALLQCLRQAKGRPVSTVDIMAFVASKFAEAGVEAVDRKMLHQSVRYRLKHLVYDGLVHPHHPKFNVEMGRWSLVQPTVE